MRRLVLLVLLALKTGSADAHAADVRSQLLRGPAPTGLAAPSLSVAPNGLVAVAWQASSTSYVAIRPAGARRFRRPLRLTSGLTQPRVAALAGGAVVITGLSRDGTSPGRPGVDPPVAPCCTAVVSQVLARGGRRLGRLRPVSVPGVDFSSFGVAFAAGGPLAAFAAITDGAIDVGASDRAGRFGLPREHQADAGDVAVAVGQRGRGAALWVTGSNGDQELWGRSVAAGRGPGAARRYAPTPDPRSDFAFSGVAADADRSGRLSVLSVDTGSLTAVDGAPAAVRIASGPATGPLGPPQELLRLDGAGAGVTEPALDVAPGGAALAAWRDREAGVMARDEVRVAVRSAAGGRFGPSAVVPGAFGPTVATLPAGGGLLVYGLLDATAHARWVDREGRLGQPFGVAGRPPAGSPAVAVAATSASRVTLVVGDARGLRITDVAR